jgi:hypothetical protein
LSVAFEGGSVFLAFCPGASQTVTPPASVKSRGQERPPHTVII